MPRFAEAVESLVREKSVLGESGWLLDAAWWGVVAGCRRSARSTWSGTSSTCRRGTCRSTRNFYPLGSCTMKYNPKRHERLAALPGFADLHPLPARRARCQGMLAAALRDAGVSSPRSPACPPCSLQPAAGAQGELTALLRRRRLLPRPAASSARKVLIPDSAHGTNPASAAMAGFEAVTVKSNADGPRRSGRPEGRSSTTTPPCS